MIDGVDIKTYMYIYKKEWRSRAPVVLIHVSRPMRVSFADRNEWSTNTTGFGPDLRSNTCHSKKQGKREREKERKKERTKGRTLQY